MESDKIQSALKNKVFESVESHQSASHGPLKERTGISKVPPELNPVVSNEAPPITLEQKDKEIVCVDPVGYSTELHRHKSAVISLNTKIEEYEALFSRPITDDDFHALKYSSTSTIKASYYERVDEMLASTKSRILREMERKALLGDSLDFFNSLAYYSISGLTDPHRIRLEQGRAVFDDNDSQILLEDKFAIDLSKHEYSTLIQKFENFKNAYDDLFDHLKIHKKVIKINPQNEAIIAPHSDDRVLINIDHKSGFNMTLNLRPLIGRHWVG